MDESKNMDYCMDETAGYCFDSKNLVPSSFESVDHENAPWEIWMRFLRGKTYEGGQKKDWTAVLCYGRRLFGRYAFSDDKRWKSR